MKSWERVIFGERFGASIFQLVKKFTPLSNAESVAQQDTETDDAIQSGDFDPLNESERLFLYGDESDRV